MAMGVGFFLAARNDAVGDNAVDLVSWARPLYTVGAVYLFVMGLVGMMDFSAYRERQRTLTEEIRRRRGAYDE
jgi:hypothetical protein